jgi:2-dehydro-3-deoxyphosphogluconate aldolase/(4S)-4-hydroxy-2-oxoglutarate aldolase
MDAGDLLDGVGIVAVVALEDADAAVPLARALAASGVSCVEVTLRTGCAVDAIGRIAREVPEVLVGAGSIRRPEQLLEVRDAGARFAVSPGSSDRLLAAARRLKMPFVPGAVTPTEMIGLLERGYFLQKFFPAEASGGARALRSLAAPLPEVRFFPTGGITQDLACEYLQMGSVACIGGSWFVPADSLRAGDFSAIGRLAVAAVELTTLS